MLNDTDYQHKTKDFSHHYLQSRLKKCTFVPKSRLKKCTFVPKSRLKKCMSSKKSRLKKCNYLI